MKAHQLPKEIYNKAVALGVKTISLNFSGGNDEGYLNVGINPEWNKDLALEIEKWAWEVYEYNGAGEGMDYGDDIVYDLENKQIISQEWYTARKEGDSHSISLSSE